ncbi:MAG TPA: HAMP domain-containing sensor histidine kinase [Solirubrobacteraceae bacterium]|nr:HAMP domain-containing sensor histidine kinase [Solirubrobacteraceae bacterium]
MSLRLRTAIGFTALAAVLVTLVGVTTYNLLRSSMLTEIRRDVSQKATLFASTPTPDLDMFASPDTYLQVDSSRGAPVRRSANLGPRTLPLTAAMRGSQAVRTTVTGKALFAAAHRTHSGRYVIVAQTPATLYSALDELRRLLYVIGAAAVAVAAILGWLFAYAITRPLARVASTAHAVRQRMDLSQRVAAGRAEGNEMTELADTFNAMLAELERTYDKLAASNRQLREFLADCSHELRAPLTLILANLDLIVRTGEEDTGFRDQALADIRREAERMSRMIRQLLILARADAGAEVVAEPVELGSVIRSVGRQAGRMSNGTRFDLDPKITCLDPLTVNVSAEYLEQQLLILLDNAFKYAPEGGQVTLSAQMADDAVHLSVTDTGPGIEDRDLPNIFERFYRGHNVNGTTGTGLGLPIAQWIAQQHHGSIQVESRLGHGSRFTIVLPCAAGPA